MIKTWHNANNVVANMPRHPRILAPTTTAVTLPAADGTEAVCGCLYPFYQRGDVGSLLEKSNEEGSKLPIETKRRWCLQMAEAIHHTHWVARTYHMDIKPGVSS